MSDNMFSPANGGRDDVVDVVVLFTDGRSTNGLYSTWKVADTGKEKKFDKRIIIVERGFFFE